MAKNEDVKVNGSYLLPLSLKRWIADKARERNVSTAEIVREILEAARTKERKAA